MNWAAASMIITDQLALGIDVGVTGETVLVHGPMVRDNGRMIRDALPMQDAERIAEIYNHYVAHDIATFEVDEIGGAVMANRIAAVQAAGLPWIVATDALGVVGYAYASPFHDRAAYRHTVTTSVYLDRAERGHGLGRSLYAELLPRVELIERGSAFARALGSGTYCLAQRRFRGSA